MQDRQRSDLRLIVPGVMLAVGCTAIIAATAANLSGFQIVAGVAADCVAAVGTRITVATAVVGAEVAG